MVIMSSALVLLTTSWSGAFLRVRKTQQQFEIASMLERKMSDIELEYRGKSTEEIPEEKAEDFGSEFPEYSWKMKSNKLEIPDISSTLTAADGGADELLMSLIKQLTEGMSKAIKEVTVTVIYNNGKGKPMEYSVTTYFIDFEKDLALAVPTGP